MASSNSLPQRLHSSFEKIAFPNGLRLFVVRRDGLMVWERTASAESQSLAALCGGVWEAAFAMAQAAGTTKSVNGFRLVFDDSSSGVVIHPLKMDGETYYLGSIYHECVNPGRLRRQVQLIGQQVEEEVNRGFTGPKKVETAREGFLFTDITDAEMDRLFGA